MRCNLTSEDILSNAFYENLTCPTNLFESEEEIVEWIWDWSHNLTGMDSLEKLCVDAEWYTCSALCRDLLNANANDQI